MNTENHYSETDLGNISIHLCGEYDPQRAYEYLDAVEFGGGSYICAIEYGKTITGIAPEPTKNTEYWHINSIPGTLTPEYIAMHDRVVNISEQVEADAEEVRAAEQNVSGMELNITQMQEHTRQAAESAEQSKDSAAGYAASADASRRAAEESEQNINAQVTGFDSHVAEKTEEAENDIEAARIAANKAIIAQQEQSVNEVSRVGIEAVSTAQAAAQTATEKAREAATSEKNAATSETAAKLSETNATKMSEQVAADKEQVANDRTAVENAKQEMTGSVAQIEQNTQRISELKTDLVDITEPQSYKDLLENMTWENGYISQSNGEILPGDPNKATDYIEFADNEHIFFYGGTPNQLVRWATYHSDKSFSASYFFYLNENGEYDFSYDAPFNSHSYLRFSITEPIKCYYGSQKEVEHLQIKKRALTEIKKLYDYIVSKDESGDFTTVTDACNAANSGESIYIKNGVYDNEVIVGTWSKKLYLVGESAKDTIIKNSLGDYNRPPIQIGSGYLKNITFYSEYTGTQERGTGATMSYAVHSESDNLSNDNLTIEDCILISDYAPSFGMGMRGGCNVTLKNCYLKGTYSGALLFHDADNVSFVGEQNISVIDCVLYDTNNSSCIIMQSQEREGTIVNLEMIRNRLKTNNAKTYGTHNYYGGTGGEYDFLGLINFRLKETSWGNSDTIFDAD